MRSAWVVMTLVTVIGCGRDATDQAPLGQGAAAVDTTGLRDLPVPPEHADGRAVFDLHCAECHGEAALGTERGPPLVHIVYEPSHHADIAFVFAVTRGVRAHHWRFGDMPPVPSVSPEETSEVIGYVRWLQREAGIH